MKSMTEEIAELRALAVPDLVARYTALFEHPPRIRHRVWLWKRIAWKLQERRTGGLSRLAKHRLERLIAEIEFPPAETMVAESGRTAPPPACANRNGVPAPGTVLVRQWRGREVRAVVLPTGVEIDGIVYRTLSAAAKAITGSHCSGPRWFGLVGPKAKAS